ncbi:anamorsin homolog [Thrips palmi]|uniref:Anamorsin homolog n=1 Tax=Thrips palmi TaxID=161013 RepID=A0A6P9A0Q9_THRPL|nr:anamorsin homolog [Thrips palmi]
MEFVKPGLNVLIVWGSSAPGERLQSVVEEAKKLVGDNGLVAVENVDRLAIGAHPASHFDLVLSGLVQPGGLSHSNDTFVEILRVLKPNGLLVVREPTGTATGLRTPEKLSSTLKISGFTSLSQIPQSDAEEGASVVQFKCQKPNFEVGSSAALSLPKPADSVAAVWKIDDVEDDTVDLIDSDQLLDEEDLKKPDAASLKVCGTTGVRKACKNCSCGLAEELAAEGGKKEETTTKTSSCGSCYLGDAFRCASCPYLGMPAFKPGEKVQLANV